MKKILFVIDKLELKYFEFNKLVTNFWLIREFLNRQQEVYITTIPKLSLKSDVAYAECYKSYLYNDDISYEPVSKFLKIDDFDIVLFRPDPPVDVDYINATYIFDFVKHAKVINSPFAIRNFNEKLHSVYFNEYMSENMVSSSIKDIETFLKIHKQIVLKPLNCCFGSGVMYLYDGDPNTNTIIKTMTHEESTLVMVQNFIPEVKMGDIRVLLLGDKVLKYAVRKLPTNDDFKFNIHSDEYIEKYELSQDEIIYFTPVAKRLNSLNLPLVGLDVINGKIIEINVTSPCYFIDEINNRFGINLENEICDYIMTYNLISL